jgi:hypothetical protein
MKQGLIGLLLAVIWGWGQPAVADALMQSQALKASTISQYFIDEKGVRVELEIGAESVERFRNLLPDAIYQQFGYGDTPRAERLQTFFGKDLAIFAEGAALPGFVAEIGPSRRVLRDPINGTPLPIQDEAPDVVRVTLVYPFEQDPLPSELMFTAPRGGDIGFVVYHRGVAVNDYRYLAPGYVLKLDWDDPWYSRFTTRNLARQYSEPMSGFIYVENFEVRKEIIVRPKDLQRWVDLGLEGRDSIPVEMQAGIKQKVGEFLALHQPVKIDGVAVEGILDSVNFLERTLTSSRVIDPPESMSLDAAIIGTIFVYPRDGLPQTVVMDWDLWDERIQRIPVSAVDQAGPLPSFLEPEWRLLEWTNFLKNYPACGGGAGSTLAADAGQAFAVAGGAGCSGHSLAAAQPAGRPLPGPARRPVGAVYWRKCGSGATGRQQPARAGPGRGYRGRPVAQHLSGLRLPGRE